MKCEKCQNDHQLDHKFCSNCGSPLEAKALKSEEPVNSEALSTPLEYLHTDDEKETTNSTLQEEHVKKRNLSFLALIVSFFFSIIAVIFSLQLQKELEKVNEQLKHHASSPYCATQDIAPSHSGMKDDVLQGLSFSSVQLSETAQGVKGRVFINVTPESTFDGTPIAELSYQDSLSFMQAALIEAWSSFSNEDLQSLAKPMKIELYINEKKQGFYDGNQVFLNK